MSQYVESFKDDFLKSIERRVEYALTRAERETGVRELQPHWNRGKIVLQKSSLIVPDVLGGVRDDVSFKIMGIGKNPNTTDKQYRDIMALAAELSDDFPNLIQKTMFDQPTKRAEVIAGGIQRCVTCLKSVSSTIPDEDVKESCNSAIEILEFIKDFMHKEDFAGTANKPWDWE